jgi:hypothetical protein
MSQPQPRCSLALYPYTIEGAEWVTSTIYGYGDHIC